MITGHEEKETKAQGYEVFGLRYYLENNLIFSICPPIRANLESFSIEGLNLPNSDHLAVINPTGSALRDIPSVFLNLLNLEIYMEIRPDIPTELVL